MHPLKPADFSRIAQDLQIRRVQVESVVALLDEGNTVPFITRYRKERTGGLNEEVIRQIQARAAALRQLAERKATVLKSIEGQGKLTDELREAVLAADTSRRLEDLYLPYKPKKKSLAAAARDKGLGPLAEAIWSRDPAALNLAELLPAIVDAEKGLATAEDIRQGVQHILAEHVADNAEVRAAARRVLWESARLTASRSETLAEGKGQEYESYFKFSEDARRVPPHRLLAINRGEREGALKVRVEWDVDAARRAALGRLPLADHPHVEFLHEVAEDALNRLLLPSLERELRRELTEAAEAHALRVFARNLRNLLMQPPLPGRRVLAIDPGFRTGCKVAALDETGNPVAYGVIHPHAPQNKRAEAKLRLEELIRRHQTPIVVIGNGTGCRETEELVAELIAEMGQAREGQREKDEGREVTAAGASTEPPAEPSIPHTPPPPSGVEAEVAGEVAARMAQPPADEEVVAAVKADASEGAAVEPSGGAAAEAAPSEAAPPAAEPPPIDLSSLPPAPADLAYVIVNEAGASVYSTSAVGREEFPDRDAALRGTVSIGRRLQDPLSELVKIDPQSIGVGLYQHDVNPRRLRASLEAVVESAVNEVGIDLNTAGVPLLRYVSGLNQLVARDLVEYRKQHGLFRSREQLLNVPNVGPARYVQAAGFLKIRGGDEPLDRTWIHPESYPATRQLLTELGTTPQSLEDREQAAALRDRLKEQSPEELAGRLQLGMPTVRDILEALARPGRDPREDLPPPVFRKGMLRLEDLQPGMELRGTVLNVVDFGAFVDVGLKDSGLVHISQIANRYIRNPYDVVAVGDVVTVWVLSVDFNRRRVSLTMIPPGTERRGPERKKADVPPAESRRGKRRGPRRGPRRMPEAGEPAVAATPEKAPPAPVTRQEPVPDVREPAAPQAPEAPVEVAATPSVPPVPATTPVQPARPPARVARAGRGPGGPKRPKRARPKPHLSQAALESKAPLRSFRELEVFFEVKGKEPPAPPAP